MEMGSCNLVQDCLVDIDVFLHVTLAGIKLEFQSFFEPFCGRFLIRIAPFRWLIDLFIFLWSYFIALTLSFLHNVLHLVALKVRN